MNSIKVVILAGGFGSRLGKFTRLKPKPMVDICGKPIIEHIINIYKKHKFFNFIICAGYKSEFLKRYFKKKFNKFIIKNTSRELLIKKDKFTINIIDTGKNTLTGGRIKRLKRYLNNDKFFHMTYGDGLAKINVRRLNNFHIKNKRLATVTAVKIQVPQERFGVVNFKNKNKNIVKKFIEKPNIKEIHINGGFFVLSTKIFDYISGDKTRWEASPLQKIAKNKQLAAFKHNGFWKCMDTPRDRNFLNGFKNKKLPWV